MTPTSRCARDAAERVAEANGVDHAEVRFPDGETFAPVRIRVEAREVVEVRRGDERREVPIEVVAEAELAPAATDVAVGGGYDGPLAYRQGKPMRPDVALAFDRMERAAREDGVTLLVNSGYRSDAEQAVLFAANPDPKWVAPPGTSLHRNGTELDLGPRSAYGWLALNADALPLHPALSARAVALRLHAQPALDTAAGRAATAAASGSAMPAFVPARFAPMLARAAQRWNVSAALLAAQIYAESNFNPFARQPAGRRGSRSSCRARRRPWASPTRSRPARRSTPRRT